MTLTLVCKSNYIESFDGEKIFTVQQGCLNKPKKDIIFISGLGGGVTSLTFPIEKLLQLEPNLRCITLDLRGHSKSSHCFPLENSSLFEIFAKDLSYILKKMEIKNPIIVAHSLGGLVLHTYLEKSLTPSPEFSIFVAVPFSGHYLPSKGKYFFYQLLSKMSSNFKPKAPMLVETHLKYKNSFDFSIGRIFNDILTMGISEFILIWLNVFSWRMPSYKNISNSKLFFIFGDHDKVVNKNEQEKIKNHFKSSHFFTVNTNHNIIVNEPKKLAEIINKLLTD